MEQFLGIKYKSKSSENLEEYLKQLNMNMFTRKAALAVHTVAVLTRDENGVYTYSMTSTLKNATFSFKLGEEFDEERGDGVKVKSVITIENGDLIQIQTEENGRKSKTVRQFTPETMIVTTTIDGWDGKCVRLYEAMK